MPRTSDLDRTLPCRHAVDQAAIQRLISLLNALPTEAPDLINRHTLPTDPALWRVTFAAAVESIRGTSSASTSEKRRFIEAVLAYMKDGRFVTRWEFIGSGGRQDYRIALPDGTIVCVEAKGCPDGNNMTIWERPTWADEFIVWSQCPESLANQPGRGAWSGIATRLLPKSIVESVLVDAMIFWDARCGTAIRRCPKMYGVEGVGLRVDATDIPGQDGREWIPPPCIYLFPRQIAHVPGNNRPPVHTHTTCRFADALLGAFNVPEDERHGYVHDVAVEMRLQSDGRWIRISVAVAEPATRDLVEGNWKRVRRE